jgi:hypothetical protein
MPLTLRIPQGSVSWLIVADAIPQKSTVVGGGSYVGLNERLARKEFTDAAPLALQCSVINLSRANAINHRIVRSRKCSVPSNMTIMR